MKTAYKIGLALIAFALFFWIIIPKKPTAPERSDWEIRYELEKAKKSEAECLKQQYLDSTVNLSFCGIKLGEPFKKTVSAAKNNETIHNVRFEKDGSATCNANLLLPNRENPLTVDVKICSYQDTITSYLIMSDAYDTKEALKSLYLDKYNEKAAERKDDAEYWGDKVRISGYWSWIWTFKNQSLNLAEFYEEERENYVKDARMRSPENRYGVRYTKYFKTITIIYSDLAQCAKVQKYEDELAAEAELKKEASDAAKKSAQEAINKKAASQDI